MSESVIPRKQIEEIELWLEQLGIKELKIEDEEICREIDIFKLKGANK